MGRILEKELDLVMAKLVSWNDRPASKAGSDDCFYH